MRFDYVEKSSRLTDPVATIGSRLYCICAQNGQFPDPDDGHVPHEMWGIWAHPIKLLDGFVLAVRPKDTPDQSIWLADATVCRAYGTHTEFEFHVGALTIIRRDFVPDGIEGMVITLTVTTSRPLELPLEIVALFRSDLQPAWLGERVALGNGPDSVQIDAERGTLRFIDRDHPWTVLVGSSVNPREISANPDTDAIWQTAGQGATAGLTCPMSVDPSESTSFCLFIAGSAASADAAWANLEYLIKNHSQLFEVKRTHYASISNGSELLTSDPLVDRAFHWAKLNCQMLMLEVPPLGRGSVAGLPEYPWWFGIDTAYSALPMLQAGLFDLTMDTLRLLRRASETENAETPGRVIHELTTTGVVYNPGNLVETPAFTRAVHECWLWTGDRSFLKDMYPFCKQGMLDYTLGAQDPDEDLCPAGRSLIETPEMHGGFECLDSATYTWEALRRLSEMASAVGDVSIVNELATKARELGDRLRNEWWLEKEGLFADLRASPREIEESLKRLQNREVSSAEPAEVRQRHEQLQRALADQLEHRTESDPDSDLPWLLRHWVVTCPLEVGLATPQQAAATLDRLESDEFCGEWGMYLHPDRRDIMSINTAVLAISEARYGRPDMALSRVYGLAKSVDYRMPGAISEALPDRWCFIQLWSCLGVISTIVHGFFGIQPHAANALLRVAPCLPRVWRSAALRHLRIGEARFDVNVERGENYSAVAITAIGPAHDLEIGCWIPETAEPIAVTVDNRSVDWWWEDTSRGRFVVCRFRGSGRMHTNFR